jgi:hypothetical protein
MADIIQNSIDGRIAEAIARQDLKDNGFIVYESKRAGYDNVSILLDAQGRIQQLYVCEVKKVPGPGGITRLSNVQKRLKKLCKATHVDHITIRVSEQQIFDWIFKNMPRGGAM